jgi:hypothetical protein
MILLYQSSNFQFMHEVGHNFNSGHTHDYSPVIDTCGTACPAGLPLAKSSTIMSYCHGCSGGYANMDYTFGGKYKGSGIRSDINSYNNSPLAGTISFEPRRVSALMWQHVSSRGTCTNVPYTGVSILLNITMFNFIVSWCIYPLTKTSTPSFTPAAADYVEAHIRSNTM